MGIDKHILHKHILSCIYGKGAKLTKSKIILDEYFWKISKYNNILQVSDYINDVRRIEGNMISARNLMSQAWRIFKNKCVDYNCDFATFNHLYTRNKNLIIECLTKLKQSENRLRLKEIFGNYSDLLLNQLELELKYLYLLVQEDKFKIGISTSPSARRWYLEKIWGRFDEARSCYYELDSYNVRKIERDLHNKFKNYNMMLGCGKNGFTEFFSIDVLDECVNYIGVLSQTINIKKI